MGVPPSDRERLPSGQPAPDHGPPRRLAQSGVQVPSRPDWYFVKLHTHGAPEGNQRVLLGEPMMEFHRALASEAAEDPSFPFPLRDGPRDVQSRPCRRGRLAGNGRRRGISSWSSTGPSDPRPLPAPESTSSRSRPFGVPIAVDGISRCTPCRTRDCNRYQMEEQSRGLAPSRHAMSLTRSTPAVSSGLLWISFVSVVLGVMSRP